MNDYLGMAKKRVDKIKLGHVTFGNLGKKIFFA